MCLTGSAGRTTENVNYVVYTRYVEIRFKTCTLIVSDSHFLINT